MRLRDLLTKLARPKWDGTERRTRPRVEPEAKELKLRVNRLRVQISNLKEENK